MNWEALGAIGETLGAFAVFVTLGYLAVQVSHAREEVRRSTSRARSEARRDALAIVADARTLPLIVKAAVAEGGGVSPFHSHAMTHWGMTREEAVFLAMSLAATWQTRLQLIAYLDDLSPYERHEFEGEVRMLYGQPGAAQRFYEMQLKPSQHPEVVRYIESVLAQPA
jgi:hypothetical protein